MEAISMATITGLAAGGAVLATQRIDEGNISLSVAVTVIVFVGGIIWLLASRFQRIDDRLDRIEKVIETKKGEQ